MLEEGGVRLVVAFVCSFLILCLSPWLLRPKRDAEEERHKHYTARQSMSEDDNDDDDDDNHNDWTSSAADQLVEDLLSRVGASTVTATTDGLLEDAASVFGISRSSTTASHAHVVTPLLLPLRRSISLPRKLDTSFLSLPPASRDTLARPSRLQLRTRSVDALTRFPHSEQLAVLDTANRRRSRLVMDLLYAASNNNNNHGWQQPRRAPPPVPPQPRWRAARHLAAPRHPHLARPHHRRRVVPDRWAPPPDHVRLQLLMAREQAFLASSALQQQQQQASVDGESSLVVDTTLQRNLKPIQGNDPDCTSFTQIVSSDEGAQLLATALEHNTVLQTLHLHPSGWKDLGMIKKIAKIIRQHVALEEIHLYQNNNNERQQHNFVSQLAWDILIQAMHRNPHIQQWGLHFAASSLEQETITDTLCHCIATCTHLKTLHIIDEQYRGSMVLTTGNNNKTNNNTNASPHCKLARAIAQATALQTLHLQKVDHSYMEYLFRECARSTSCLQALHIESTSHAGTAGLETFLTQPSCQLKTLQLKHVQTFQRVHMDQLVGGLTNNKTVKHIAFMDCGFHPEVVRPLQDLVRKRLDLESFQLTRCQADPTMAVLTCFQNNHSQVASITMGYSLGIEDRLGGDAIRSVLRYNSTLQSLNLTGSHRLGQVGLRHLARGLGKNSTLAKLDLSHCSVPLPSLALMIQHVTGNPTSALSSINLSHNSLSQGGVRLLVDDWLLHPNSQLRELILNRCDMVPEATLMLIRAISNNTTPLEVLEMMECGRLTVNALQEIAESLFRMGNLRVLKASCFKSAVHTIRPVPAHAAAPPAAGNNNDNDLLIAMNDDSDDEDDSDLEDDPIVVAAVVEAVANRNANAHLHNIQQQPEPAMTGSMRLLRETFLAGLIHNQRLEHISLVNVLECVMKPKDAARVRAWMDFCGKRNCLQPLLQQSEIPLLEILLDIVRECRDPRTRNLNATGLSLTYHCLCNRPDALDRVQRMLTEAERLDEMKVSSDGGVPLQG
ncbi:expressed unknown protein [Seminavis robusta]|uniref:Uncharacterized protein n=1 Tax=Seminavis robusta TaxID=568900 RepID=A0A9N8DSA8_9STRA|nr:expressed unknown protein [Seminavis robusta]|eukprot:Sro334_g119920.1 n/a (1008) ;mRNA; f:64773-67796